MATRRPRKQATRGSSRTVPAWIWLSLGVLMGVAVSAFFIGGDWFSTWRSKQSSPQPNARAVAPRESEAPLANQPGKDSKPRKNYDFYSVLPEMEVVIPDAELAAKAREETRARTQPQAATPASNSTTPAATTAGVRYLLQAGSYPDAKAAEEVKAKLAMSGFIAQVQPVTINGKTWNRVRLGPYASASALEAAKRDLAESGINAIALKEDAGN